MSENENPQRTDRIGRVATALSESIAKHGLDSDRFYSVLANEIDKAGETARAVAQVEDTFSDPAKVNALREQYTAELRERAAGIPNMVPKVKNEYRQRYGKYAELLWSEPARW